jgi:hypothetical protein
MTNVLRLELPELTGPFPVVTHPSYKLIEHDSSAWVRAHLAFAFPDAQPLDRFIACLYPLWVCLCYPTAIDTERLLNVCNFQQFMFFIDDSDVLLSGDQETARRILPRLRALLRGGAPDGPFEEAFTAAWQPIAAGLPAAQQERFAADLMAYCLGSAEEILTRTARRPASLDEHIKRRHRSTGAYFCLHLMEYGLGIDLTGELRRYRELAQIRDLLAEEVGLVNDILSYRKEHFTGDGVNAVRILQDTQRLTLQRAIDHVAAMARNADEQFFAQRERLLSGPLGRDPRVTAYLEGMGHMIGGNTRWHFLTPRYNGTGYVWGGITSGPVAWYPDRTVFGEREAAMRGR